MMKRFLVILAFLICQTFSFAYAQQNNNEESLTIHTYYPAPYGVYYIMRLVPNDDFFENASCDGREGETFYHNTTHELLICQGAAPKWTKLGSGSAFASALRIETGQLIPSQCSTGAPVGGPSSQFCHDNWWEQINFSPAFNNPPKVMVFGVNVSDPISSACAHGRVDEMAIMPYAISKAGFRVVAEGSPAHDDESLCGPYASYQSRAEVSWLAIGD